MSLVRSIPWYDLQCWKTQQFIIISKNRYSISPDQPAELMKLYNTPTIIQYRLDKWREMESLARVTHNNQWAGQEKQSTSFWDKPEVNRSSVIISTTYYTHTLNRITILFTGLGYSDECGSASICFTFQTFIQKTNLSHPRVTINIPALQRKYFFSIDDMPLQRN